MSCLTGCSLFSCLISRRQDKVLYGPFIITVMFEAKFCGMICFFNCRGGPSVRLRSINERRSPSREVKRGKRQDLCTVFPQIRRVRATDNDNERRCLHLHARFCSNYRLFARVDLQSNSRLQLALLQLIDIAMRCKDHRRYQHPNLTRAVKKVSSV
jgi:hypothetical protein